MRTTAITATLAALTIPHHHHRLVRTHHRRTLRPRRPMAGQRNMNEQKAIVDITNQQGKP